MATVLRIKRSSAGSTTVPSSLKPSELAYAEGTSTYSDVPGGSIVSHGKMYYGRGIDNNGNATTVDIIGGKYFTDMLDHQHGTLTTNSAIVVDSASKIDVLNVDNITLDGNTFSSTDANGNLNFDTNGTGTYIFSGAATHDTNFFKINDGSTDRFVVDSFSGALDITTPSLSNADTVLNIDSTWNNDVVFKGIAFNVTDTDSNDASRLLELSVGGAKKFDVDKSGNVSLTGNVTFDNQTTFGIQDNTADAFLIKEGTNNYINIDTTDDSEKITFGNTLSSIDNIIEDDAASAFTIKEGSNSYFNITTTDSSELITFGTADVTIDNDLSVNGGDIKTTQTSFDLINTSAVTVNFAGAATAINIGASGAHTTTLGSGTLVGTQTTQNVFNATATTVNFAGAGTDVQIGASTGTTNVNNNLVVDIDLEVKGGDITTNQSSFNLLNTTATTVNAFGAAETIAIGASGDYTTTLGSKTLVGTESVQNVFNATATTVNAFGAATAINIGASGAHTTTLGSGTLVGTESVQNVFNATATTVNAFGAGTDIQIGAATGTTNINNNLDVDGDVNIDGGDLTVSTASFDLINTTATTVNAFGAAETINIGASGAHTTTLGSGTLVGTQTTQNVFNATATTVNAFGAATAINMGSANTTLDLGNIRIFGNTISTDSSSATELIIDPFPDAGDAGGDVIIRGNLQVAGTTTTVNSTEMSVNDPVFTIGDSVTEKTVLTIAASGATDIIIDNPSGVVESATITGTGIGSGRTISNVKIAFNVGGSLSTTPNVGDDIYFYDGTSFSLLGTYDSESTGELVINLASNISTRGDDFYNGNQLTTDSSGTPSNTASITKVDTKVFKTTTITLSDVTTGSVAAETKLTISQASDDNLDRGIQFKYLKTNASKVGFFGYDDDTEYFTFIPDASNNSNLFSGTKGEAWFKTVKLDDGINLGVPYFNSNLELTRTVAGNTSASFFKIDSGEVDGGGNPIMVGSSNAFLTVDASGVPIWSDTLDGGSF